MDTDLAAIGFSLGGNTLVQWIAEEANAAVEDRPELLAAATISAPIDLVTSTRQLDGVRNWPYRPYLLKKLRDHACREASQASDELKQAARECRSMWEFGAKFNGPRLGFEDGDAYFGSASLVDGLPKVDVPLLMIHSRDDPWVPHAQYERMKWSMCPSVEPLFSDRGGHLGFHSAGSFDAWDIHCADRFIAHHA
jgi:predicted alpha/beta-fold hydrolase